MSNKCATTQCSATSNRSSSRQLNQLHISHILKKGRMLRKARTRGDSKQSLKPCLD